MKDIKRIFMTWLSQGIFYSAPSQKENQEMASLPLEIFHCKIDYFCFLITIHFKQRGETTLANSPVGRTVTLEVLWENLSPTKFQGQLCGWEKSYGWKFLTLMKTNSKPIESCTSPWVKLQEFLNLFSC